MAYSIRNIFKSFDTLAVLEGISLDFQPGSISVILGPSGCGKTTLLNVIAGLCAFEKGERSGFSDIRFSYAFQEPRLLPWMSARENAALALSGIMSRDEALPRVDALLQAAGLGDAWDRRPDQLSGGMRQRLSLVRAFAYPADFLLLDEAFTAVDLKTKIELMDVFLDLWRREKPTVVSVTHDVEEAVYLADRVIALSDRPGKLIDDFAITTPREERKLGASTTMEAEARLYRRILGLDEAPF
jgi:NitT/TauT family transport system ATP-binding protein